MTFLQPELLWGLPLILVPVIIHLINRLRHRPQQWAAIQFLLAANKSSTSHAKLKQFLVLLFRTLAVLGLVLFLSRPLSGGWLGWAWQSSPDAILILMDRSASMETVSGDTSRRERALAMLNTAAQPYEGKSQFVLIDSSSANAQSLPSIESLTSHPSTQATHTSGDFPTMLQTALDWIADNQPGRVEIWMASDLQSSNWHPEDERWQSVQSQFQALPQSIQFRMLTMIQPASANSGIKLLSTRLQERNEAKDLLIDAEIILAEETSQPIPLQLSLNGDTSTVEIQPTGIQFRWEHRIELPENINEGWGSFTLPADSNLKDNQIWFTFSEADEPSALIVGDGSRSDQVLSIAAASTIKGKMERAEITSTEAFTAGQLVNRSLLVWSSDLPSPPVSDPISNYIREGGVAVFLPTANSSATTYEGLSWGQLSKHDEDIGINDWSRDEGPLADSSDGVSLPLEQLSVSRNVPMIGDLHPMATFSNDEAFVGRRYLGRGEVYFVGTLPSLNWSSLDQGTVIVPMLQRLLHSGTRRFQKDSMLSVGRLSIADQQKLWQPIIEEITDITIDAGIFKSGTRTIAANLPSSEFERGRLEAKEAIQLFDQLSVRLFEEPSEDQSLQGEVWQLLLLGMLLFLILEGILILPEKTSSNPQPASAK